ncbi:teichoic acid biosynthesis protein C [Nonomuraea sp. NPDC050540]|uniref:phage baseplate protein n=1 Tax=Nonomuraea sp. NPDC050540 TaxID=3364367 RepID=UPI0037B5FA3A
MTRRGLIAAGAGALAAGITGPSPAQARTAGRRFDLTGPPTGLLWRKPLKDQTVLQSLAFDNRNGHIYTAQVKNGAASARAGDLCVTKLSLSGAVLGHMYLMGFGHGVQIAVEPVGSLAYLWTETDGASDGQNAWGRKIARFPFVSGTTLTTRSASIVKYAPVPGATSTTCAIDPSTNRLVMRYRLNGGVLFTVYDLDALKAGNPVSLGQAEQPPGLGTFQGYTMYQDHLYLLDGNAYGPANPPPGNTHLTSVSLVTGRQVERRFTAAAKSLDYREPEGMAIQIAGGQPRLCYGLAAGRAGARLVSIVYKSKLV